MNPKLLFSFFGIICYFSLVSSKEHPFSKAEVQSCSGCQLRSLPEVKAFIFEDVPKYENVVFKHIQGAPPELVFYSDSYQELERHALKGLTREECNQMLTKNGFHLKEEEATVKKEL